MNNYSITLDVGGTSIKAAIVKIIPETSEGTKFALIEHSYKSYPAKSDEDCESIIANIVDIIKEQYSFIEDSDFVVSSISFGFPGPFDYENATSLMKGLGKYDSIYNVNIEIEIRKKLAILQIARLPADIKITFLNDATLFAIGEYHASRLIRYPRIIVITLGTGCGSTFLADGKIVKGKFGVPQNGMVYNVPFNDGIIDDYVSRRYILSLASEAGFDTAKLDVKELVELAKAGNEYAIKIFDKFGATLGQALRPFIESFNADAILFGGQISKSFSQFQSAFEGEISPYKPEIVISQSLSKSALIGAAIHAEDYRLD